MNKKTVILQGGLGNQLFIYAFSMNQNINGNNCKIVTTLNNKVSKYFVKHNFHPDEDYLKKVIVIFCKLNNRAYWFKIYNKWFPLFHKLERISDHEDFNEQLLKINNNGFIECFFQSALFFEHIKRKGIKNYFKLKDEYVIEYQKLIKQDQVKPNIVIHIRRGDYQMFGNDNFGGKDLCLPISYYKAAISRVKDLDKFKVFIVSDDEDYVKNNVDFIEYELKKGNEIQDFQVIMHADIIIMANSTFSFWASILNNKAKKVLMPDFWLGVHLKKRIREIIFQDLPLHWEIIDF